MDFLARSGQNLDVITLKQTRLGSNSTVRSCFPALRRLGRTGKYLKLIFLQ